MRKNFWNYLPVVVLLGLSMAVAPVFRAQSGTLTRITPVPDGAEYTVDGQIYIHPTSALWPVGSKHILAVPNTIQTGQVRTLLAFQTWQFAGTSLPLNPLPVTASAAINEYQAIFTIQYGLGIAFASCPDPSNCNSPGSIYVNGAPIFSSQDIYISANSTAVLQAYPNPGFVFAGWAPGKNQVITGFQDVVTMSAPMTVYPIFQPARSVNFATVPAGLTILADRAPQNTPSALDWGMNSVHSVGANSPQRDQYGKAWVFQSWSDGGAENHAYTVAPLTTPATLTATYGPGAAVDVLSQPTGMKILVDGQYNALNPYYFVWGTGETHTVSAPQQQTDAQGQVWQFSSWSNGGAATQSIVVPAGADASGIRLTATYTKLTRLTVTSTLTGLSVNVDGAACTTPCEVLRNPGTRVKISAPSSISLGPGARADFDGWPGGAGDLAVTVGDSSQTVNASYHMMNLLSTASNPQNGAVWTIQPASPDGFYNANASVALNLTPQPGYRFRQWNGDLSGTYPAGTLTMNAPRAVTALFDAVPYVAPTGVNNAAGSTPQQSVAPGSIISIFGANLTNATATAPGGQLPQSLAGLTVSVGDRILPLLFASPQQINAQLPDDTGLGTQVLTISPTGQANLHTSFTVTRNAPGLFPVAAAGGVTMPMAIHEDGTAVTADAPAIAGELLTVYGTGFGPTSQARPEGFPVPSSPPVQIVDTVTVSAGTLAVAAENAFAVAGQFGIDAVQFRLDGSVSGNLTFKVTVNGADSNSLTIFAR